MGPSHAGSAERRRSGLFSGRPGQLPDRGWLRSSSSTDGVSATAGTSPVTADPAQPATPVRWTGEAVSEPGPVR